MRVLLTGASGFLGRYLLNRLQQYGISTAVVGRSLPNDVVPADYYQADLLDNVNFKDLMDWSGATHLLHFAWYTEHGKYWTSPLNLRWVAATMQLVEAFCNAGGQKVVMAGTCAEYDWSHGYCREVTTPTNPATLYGITRNATRCLTMGICAEHNVPCAWGRIFLTFGQGEDRRRLVPALIDVLKGVRPPFGVNAAAYRDFLHADDLAEGFIKMVLSDAVGIYNVCSGQPTQIADIVRYIANEMGTDPQAILELSTTRAGEPDFLVGDSHKLRSLGWQPKHRLASSLVAVAL